MWQKAAIAVLALVGIFIKPFEQGLFDFVFRLIMFGGITYLLFLQFPAEAAADDTDDESGTDEQTGPVQAVLDDVPEVPAKPEIIYDWNLPELYQGDEKCRQYILIQFNIITSLIFPANGMILLDSGPDLLQILHRSGNGKNGEPENGSGIIEKKGLLKILADQQAVLLENNLQPENKYLEIYGNVKYSPASFLGVRIELDRNKRMYMIFDGPEAGQFNKDDLAIIREIKTGLELFINNRVAARDYFKAFNEEKNLVNFAAKLAAAPNLSAALDTLVVNVAGLFEASRLTVSVVRTGGNKAVIKKVLGQEEAIGENFEFPLDEGLTGFVISRNKPYVLDEIEKGQDFIPRYSREEKSNGGIHSFMGLPIVRDHKVFGAITLEHQQSGKYNEKDSKRLQEYISIFASVFLRQAN